MERRLCVAECEKDKTQQRAKRSIDMMIQAKCALFSSNYKVIARAARPLKNNAGGLMSSMTQALIHLSWVNNNRNENLEQHQPVNGLSNI